MHMVLLFMFSCTIIHIVNSLLNCKFIILLKIKSYGKIYLKMSFLNYVFILIENPFNFQNGPYVNIFALKYFCSLLILFTYNSYATSGYPFIFTTCIIIKMFTCDLVSIYGYLYHIIIPLSIFTFTNKALYKLLTICTNNTMLPPCNNNIISLTLNYVTLLFQYYIIYLHIALNVMVMIIIRHIYYINNLYVCTMSKHGKYYLLNNNNYIFTIITCIETSCIWQNCYQYEGWPNIQNY